MACVRARSFSVQVNHVFISPVGTLMVIYLGKSGIVSTSVSGSDHEMHVGADIWEAFRIADSRSQACDLVAGEWDTLALFLGRGNPAPWHI